MTRHFPIDLPATSILLEAIDHTRVGVIVSDPAIEDNPIIYTNQGFLQMTGYSYEDILGKNCRFLQGPESSNAAIQNCVMLLSRKNPSVYSSSTIKKTVKNSGMNFILTLCIQKKKKNTSL